MSDPASGSPRSDDPMNSQQVCAEVSGFLFTHPCGQFARYRCGQCQKPICVQHSVNNGPIELCVSCAKGNLGNDQTPTRSYDTPYWYSTTHYDSNYHWPGSGSNDFTQADEAALTQEGDAEWEQNLGAS